MNPDPASLENLRDIVQPPPVSWWPPAPGWWIVTAVLAIVGFLAAVRKWRSWQANAYRRAALRELESAAGSAEIAAILKRTALCAYPRSQVASLSGKDWCDWLAETGHQNVPAEIQNSLTEGVFGQRGSDNTDQLSSFVSAWIHGHSQPLPQSQGSEAC